MKHTVVVYAVRGCGCSRCGRVNVSGRCLFLVEIWLGRGGILKEILCNNTIARAMPAYDKACRGTSIHRVIQVR